MSKKNVILSMLISILFILTSNSSLLGMTCCSINSTPSTTISTAAVVVNSLAFTPAGCLAIADNLGMLNVYLPTANPCVYNNSSTGPISLGTPITATAISPSGCLATASNTGVSVFVPSGSCDNCVYDPIPTSIIDINTTAVTFSANGCLVFGNAAGNVTIYGPDTTSTCTYTTLETSFTIPSGLQINSISLSPVNNCLVVGDNGGNVYSYLPTDTCTYNTVPSQTPITLSGPINSLAFSSTGCLAIAGNGEVQIYQPGTNCTYTLTTTLVGFTSPLVLAFSPTGCLAVADYTGTTAIYSSTSGCDYTTIPSSTISGTTAITALAFSPSGCLATASANAVTIYATNPALTVSISPQVTSVCSGATITLQGITAGGTGPNTYTYSWTLPDGSTVSTGTSNILTIPNSTESNSGAYTLTVMDNAGCITMNIGFVTVGAIIASLQATPETLCSSQSTSSTLTTNISGGMPPYEVTYSDGFAESTSSTTATHIVTPTVSTDYTVTIVDANGCTTMAGPVSVIVNTPVMPTISDVTVACNGTITIMGTAGAGNTIDVFNGPTQVAVPISAANDGSFSITTTVLSPGTYSNLSVVAAAAPGCSASTEITPSVVIPDPIGVTIAPEAPAILIACAGSSPTLTATGSGGTPSYTYAWTGPNNFTATGDMITIPTITRAMAGIYTVKITDSAGCTATTSKLVRVDDIGITISSSANFLCNGNSANLTAIITGGLPPYTVLFSDGYSETGPNTVIMHTVTPSMTTSYTVTATDSNGCSATSAPPNTIMVSVVTVPYNLTALSSCTGVVSITGSADPGAIITVLNGAVTVAGPLIVPTSGNFSANTSVLLAGTYMLTVTATNESACSASGTTPSVTVNPALTVSIIPASQTIALGSTLTLTANTIGGSVGTTTYNWTGPNGFSQTGASNTVIRPNATSSFAGTYSVVAIDSVNCTASASATVTVT